jgi:hypothetical protein
MTVRKENLDDKQKKLKKTRLMNWKEFYFAISVTSLLKINTF